ncbi:MAG: phenylglyoxylate dehydrogenase [Clostridiales bacterium]|nr:phenylglyoxylate dehydrogenase [Clostridiales bacterium]MCF8022037.1 phenylglyoxylate dehydrogenase [Clostridiales bacterium]
MPKTDVINGNKAAAVAVSLVEPDVIAAYPITPQSSIVEYLTQFVINNDIDSYMSEVESEHSAMSVLTGASLSGGRTFTATASQGLSLMYEPYFRASTLRLPVVMAVTNREMISPQTVWGGPQDSLSVRDAGWLQIYVEDNQEILDTIIQAYRIAEDKKVLLPINVCFDGFYLTHMTEKVEIPDKQDIDRFLPEYNPEHIILDSEKPMAVDPLTSGYLLMEYREKHLKAQQEALKLIEEVDSLYEGITGRSYGGLVENYKCDDADYVIVTMGSMTGACREAVDHKRNEGLKVGLLKIRALRPFPKQKVMEIISGKKAFGVVDRNVSFGWDTGIIYQEVKSALYDSKCYMPSVPFIGGLGGEDITIEHFEDAIVKIHEAYQNENNPQTVWLKN